MIDKAIVEEGGEGLPPYFEAIPTEIVRSVYIMGECTSTLLMTLHRLVTFSVG